MMRLGILLFLLIFTSVLFAQESPPEPTMETQYPVTIENCGRSITFEMAPQRVVTHYPPATELMLALGLEDRILGAGSKNMQTVWEPLREAYAELPEMGDPNDFGILREVLIDAEPDLVIDNQPGFFYDASQGFATIEEIEAIDAQVYTLTGRCGDGDINAVVETSFTDLRNLALVFDVQERAEALIADFEAELAEVDAALDGVEPLSFMIYDAGEGALGVWGPGQVSNVVERAGGVNVFGDLSVSYDNVSLEEVLIRNPDVVIVPSYDDPAFDEERLAYIREALALTSAVTNDRVYMFPYDLINLGLSNTEGVKTLAGLFHPDRYNPNESQPATDATAPRTEYPVTVENCGQEITISSRPERVIASWTGYVGNLLALGLDESLIGYYYYFDSDVTVNPPEMQERFDAITLLGTEGIAPSREIVIPLEPDFFYSGGDFDFAEGQVSLENFEEMGTTVFTTSYACSDPADQTIEAYLEEMLTLGVIFDRQAEAQALVAEIRDGLEAISEQVGDVEPVNVIWLDAFSSDPIYPLGNGYYTDVIERAGGVNLFEGATYDTPPSREELAISGPDVILMVTFGDVEAFLPDYEAVFQSSPAIANDQLLAGPYFGPLRTVELVEFAARTFHPSAFDQ
ncbi:MAG: ABC transporter substrate-binding protein [Chloroflexota bacterium]